ncbi:hypothetical protein P691DRAFT_319034 [Macrolepiota fuliginosa MF-IS2]|uniref:BZIP domain-containing protein n=1 Tax=Macrolepiota fuliginosa MF-IS2 TaxID=1400762 RepID=A0A9P5XJB0_9AGAR|nr:hypothetical protein P691DRAFT_319034 [Macrolepiota fuliginosa MF-IS2]
MKRKEQNRAAQRAFRERKEKHVKDLEDKVAELEAKNEVAQHENENLRDLLTRLQSENVMLKQATFTFTMPKPQADPSSAPKHFSPDNSIFTASPPSSVITPESSRISPKPTNLVDWTSLTSFDPNVLSLLDENPQPTATSSAMDLDIFDNNSSLSSGLPFTTIASNPMLMSFASSFDSMPPPTDSSSGIANGNGNRSNGQTFNFDLNSMNTWPTPTPPTQDTTSLDDLFAGYLNPNQNADFSFAATPSMSPVTHQMAMNNTNFGNIGNNSLNPFLHKPALGISRTSSMSSPSSQSTASSDLLNTPKENQSISLASSPESDHHSDTVHHKSTCPKTKTELAQRIAEAGASPFAPPGLKKSSDQTMGTVISCAGSKFPRTAKSDKNVEVLSAWKTITSNPVFKDAGVDINDLCAEFTSKAKCDGTKVVLEPEGMANIIEALSAKKQ